MLVLVALPSASAGVLAHPGGAIVFSFDDGCSTDLLAATALEAHGWRGTFYAISGTPPPSQQTCDTRLTPAQIASLATRGHDIESHTVTHPDLTKVSSSSLRTELSQSQATLSSLTGRPVRQLAYPYGAVNPAVESATALFYQSGRLYYTDFGVMPKDVTNAFELPAIGILRTTSALQARSYVDAAASRGVVVILAFHQIQSDPTDLYDSTPAQLAALLDDVAQRALPVLTVAQVLGAGSAPPTSLGAAFTPTASNEWWIQVKVTANQPLARVETRIDGGTFQPLQLRSWGDWAASYHAPQGSIVQFRATSNTGATADSGCYLWTARSPVACSGGSPPPPPSGSFAATFRNVRGNEWWVESDVSASGGTLAGVDARVNGGAFVALSHTGWGSWAKSIHAPSGSVVEFRARATDGASVMSARFAWPP